ncbi:hypothetical protein D3C76_596460 [compost metagenome]|uniref:DUF3509 domain-containing protein n=1 Tax=Pseudomonas jinjuensis TaxID=198616 RepID=A0A1H0LQJ2_9PSED|nr:DUF3509 domain-containing protein [Pseudomonas jinjuensis]SDO70140.1 Protein of unknown function [Pseudomonas jinjuensis]
MLSSQLPVTDFLTQQFHEFQLLFAPRPDGRLLVTLNDATGACVLCRVITSEEQRNPELLEGLVERIHRDIATREGPLQDSDAEHFKKHIELQSFLEGNPPLRKRRIVRAGAKLRARAQATAAAVQ